MRLTSERSKTRDIAGFSIATAALGVTFIAILAAYGSLGLGKPDDTKIFAVIIFLINMIPAAVAALILGLVSALGAGVRVFFWGWMPLTFGLSVPYWIWVERKWRRKLERRVEEEVERRLAASREGGPPNG